MPDVSLSALVRECDRLLRPDRFQDWEGAVNGLQVENRGRVRRLAAAVDVTPETLRLAVNARASLLLVHHGLFWSTNHPWTGAHYRILRLLLDNDIAVYSSHLPLDAHPRLGNSARLCAVLGLRSLRPFFETKGRPVGFRTTSRSGLERAELVRRLERAVSGPVKLAPGGPSICQRIGVVTGGAGSELAQAALEGVDTFITGEGPHWTFGQAEMLGLNVLYAGHYATETLGVQALAGHLSRRFGVPWTFLDRPTGL